MELTPKRRKYVLIIFIVVFLLIIVSYAWNSYRLVGSPIPPQPTSQQSIEAG